MTSLSITSLYILYIMTSQRTTSRSSWTCFAGRVRRSIPSTATETNHSASASRLTPSTRLQALQWRTAQSVSCSHFHNALLHLIKPLLEAVFVSARAEPTCPRDDNYGILAVVFITIIILMLIPIAASLCIQFLRHRYRSRNFQSSHLSELRMARSSERAETPPFGYNWLSLRRESARRHVFQHEMLLMTPPPSYLTVVQNTRRDRLRQLRQTDDTGSLPSYCSTNGPPVDSSDAAVTSSRSWSPLASTTLEGNGRKREPPDRVASQPLPLHRPEEDFASRKPEAGRANVAESVAAPQTPAAPRTPLTAAGLEPRSLHTQSPLNFFHKLRRRLFNWNSPSAEDNARSRSRQRNRSTRNTAHSCQQLSDPAPSPKSSVDSCASFSSCNKNIEQEPGQSTQPPMQNINKRNAKDDERSCVAGVRSPVASSGEVQLGQRSPELMTSPVRSMTSKECVVVAVTSDRGDLSPGMLSDDD